MFTSVHMVYSAKRKRKEYIWYNKHNLLILRMVFHLSQALSFLAGVGSSVHNLPMLGSLWKSICTKYLKYPYTPQHPLFKTRDLMVNSLGNYTAAIN